MANITHKFEKKAILILIILVTSLVGSHLFSKTGNAYTNKDNIQNNNQQLFVLTSPIPNKIQQFAKEKMSVVLECLPEIVSDWDKYQDESIKISLGSPFILGELVYFPILCTDKLIAVLSITNDEDMSWSVSQELIEEFNYIAPMTTFKNPVEFALYNNDIYGLIKDRTIRLTNQFNSPSKIKLTSNTLRNKQVSEAFSSSESYIFTHIGKINKLNAKKAVKNLAVDLKEKQGSEPWCAAYVGAQIMRYKYRNTTASQILQWRYPYVSNDKDLKKLDISRSKLIEYAQGKGFSSLQHFDKTLSYNEVKKQIDSYNPIYISGHLSTDTNNRHAFTLRGYDEGNKLYSFWNPWDSSFSFMGINEKYMPARGKKYIWDKTISNWHL